MNDIKLNKVEVADYKKRMAEANAKFRQQQNLFETVRAERNTSGKALAEAQDEIQELKSKLKIMNHQIEQLKEDLSTKDTSLVKDEFCKYFLFFPTTLNLVAQTSLLQGCDGVPRYFLIEQREPRFFSFF